MTDKQKTIFYAHMSYERACLEKIKIEKETEKTITPASVEILLGGNSYNYRVGHRCIKRDFFFDDGKSALLYLEECLKNGIANRERQIAKLEKQKAVILEILNNIEVLENERPTLD